LNIFGDDVVYLAGLAMLYETPSLDGTQDIITQVKNFDISNNNVLDDQNPVIARKSLRSFTDATMSGNKQTDPAEGDCTVSEDWVVFTVD